MADRERSHPFHVSELDSANLARQREALVDVTREAARSGLAPGFSAAGPDSWVEWYWDQVIEDVNKRHVRVFVAHEGGLLAGALQLRTARAAGWSGWEPWRRLRVDDLIIKPGASAGVEAELLAFALSRSLADFVVIETIPGGPVQKAAEGLGFRQVAVVADLIVGPDGSPMDAAILTRSHPVPSVISPELLAQVEAVRPSVDRHLLYRPCQVALRDGSIMDRVYVQEAWTWKQVWGVWPEDDRGKASISIDDVVAISESPSRLAPDLATRLLEAGESGMGYARFTLVLRDGRR